MLNPVRNAYTYRVQRKEIRYKMSCEKWEDFKKLSYEVQVNHFKNTYTAIRNSLMSHLRAFYPPGCRHGVRQLREKLNPVLEEIIIHCEKMEVPKRSPFITPESASDEDIDIASFTQASTSRKRACDDSEANSLKKSKGGKENPTAEINEERLSTTESSRESLAVAVANTEDASLYEPKSTSNEDIDTASFNRPSISHKRACDDSEANSLKKSKGGKENPTAETDEEGISTTESNRESLAVAVANTKDVYLHDPCAYVKKVETVIHHIEDSRITYSYRYDCFRDIVEALEFGDELNHVVFHVLFLKLGNNE